MRDCASWRSRVRPTRTSSDGPRGDRAWATTQHYTAPWTRRYGKRRPVRHHPHRYPPSKICDWSAGRTCGTCASILETGATSRCFSADASHVEEVEHARGTGRAPFRQRGGEDAWRDDLRVNALSGELLRLPRHVAAYAAPLLR